MGEPGSWQNKHECFGENTEPGTYVEPRPWQVLSEKAVNHYRESLTWEETQPAASWTTTGHPKTLRSFSTQGNGVGLVLPVRDAPVSGRLYSRALMDRCPNHVCRPLLEVLLLPGTADYRVAVSYPSRQLYEVDFTMLLLSPLEFRRLRQVQLVSK